MTLLIISPDYASHLLPLATLGTAWRDAGERVVVATGPATAAIVESFGFERVNGLGFFVAAVALTSVGVLLLYNAIHVEQTLKGERGEDSVQDIAAFYARFGVDPQQFASTMSSFAIDGKLRKAKQFATRSAIEGTPTLIVDGKYRILGKAREDQIRILDQLVAQEQAALGAK